MCSGVTEPDNSPHLHAVITLFMSKAPCGSFYMRFMLSLSVPFQIKTASCQLDYTGMMSDKRKKVEEQRKEC